MLQHHSYIQIDFEGDQATSLQNAEGCVLHCVRGRLWVTEDNGGGDVVLDAGDCYALTRRGRTVVQSVSKQSGASCQVMLKHAPRRTIAVLRLVLPLLLAGHTKLRLVIPRTHPV
jgi:hypothetical protein